MDQLFRIHIRQCKAIEETLWLWVNGYTYIYIYKYHSWGDEPPKIPLDFVETFGIQWMTHHKSSSDRSLAGKAFQSAQLPTGVLFFMNLDIQVVIYR